MLARGGALFGGALFGAVLLAAPLVAAPRGAHAQRPDLVALTRGVRGLTTTGRVLLIGARPSDDASALIAWLARGHHVETGVLTVTRGESEDDAVGTLSGAALGAAHVGELLAERRVDGGEQFFTRTYDVGFARDTAEAFSRWARDTILGDVVAVVRAFRPHVIVLLTTPARDSLDGARAALFAVAREAFAAADDTLRFPTSSFGAPWAATSMYQYGSALRIDPTAFDPLAGETYAEIGTTAAARRRSEGLGSLLAEAKAPITLDRIASRAADATPAPADIFAGADTSFTRLVREAVPAVQPALARLGAAADSARAGFDALHPERSVGALATVAALADQARAGTVACRHPSRDARVRVLGARGPCDHAALDLDASVDRIRERAIDALFAASGLVVRATADRELVAPSDAADVTLEISNYGTLPITFGTAEIWHRTSPTPLPSVVAPDSTLRLQYTMRGLSDAAPWWITSHEGNRYQDVLSAADGVARGMMIPEQMHVPGAAVPEALRRASDVAITVTIDGAPVTTSIGPVLFPHADGATGYQRRTVAGVPNVSLHFERSLEWLPLRAPIDRGVRVGLASYSDLPQTFQLEVDVPKGVRVDSLPRSITLAPHEQRSLVLDLRGRLDSAQRTTLRLFGLPPRPAQRLISGIQIVQRPDLPPIYLSHASGEWLQPIDVRLPPKIAVAYVTPTADAVSSALEQIGVPVWVVEPEYLLTVDLSRFTTVLVAARAFETSPGLASESHRLQDFARRGGRVVILRGETATLTGGALPFPVTLAQPAPERVGRDDASVAALTPRARVLRWPNEIRGEDWSGWDGPRAPVLPSRIDPRYTPVIEMHDPGQPENRNALLVAPLGRGAYVYTALTLDRQIAAGVPGALRLLVNLCSVPNAHE